MKNYPLNEAPLFEHVRELVEYIGETYSEDTAYSFRIKPFDEEIQRMSYRRLSHDVRCLATELIARGFKGKHVAIVGKMSYGWACAYLAMLSVGVVAVPLDPEWTAEDLCDTVKKAECAALFCGTETYENKTEVIKAGSDIALTVVLDSDGEELIFKA
jgi:acyl-CoA synthetase (AMP-forming)/AMP-acid ligase II